jgi:hypothetical protein
MARCHHRQCGRDFGGVTGFDRHIRLLDGPPWVECVDPASVGLILRADGVWISAWQGPGDTDVPADREVAF